VSTYVDPRTSITVIIGTLIGVAILLPFFSSGELKFKDRLNRQEKAEADKAVKLLDEGHKQLLAKDHAAAKETILRALDKLKELHKKETEYHPNGYLWLGRIAADEEDYEEALRLYNRSLQLSETFKSGPEPPKGISKVADSKMAARLKNITKGLAEAKHKTWVSHYLNCHDAISDLYREQRNYEKVVKVQQKVIAFTEKNAAQDYFLMKQALTSLARAYSDAGRARDEKKTRERLSQLRKSVKK
jgi:tetratricopeptide (TPR) repeat protein